MFDALAVLFVLAFFVGFPLVWVAVVKMIGKTGWAPLAEAYPAREWPDESYRVPRQSAQIGASRYSGTLNAAATPEGLYLRPPLLFRSGHPPVFVPWEAFHDTFPAPGGGTRFVLKDSPDLVLYGALADAVTAATQSHAEASGARG